MIKIAVISDIHLDLRDRAPVGNREFRQGDLSVKRLVRRLNRSIVPDLTVLLGDLVDEGNGPGAMTCYRFLKNQFDLIESPTIILPGNHDGVKFDEVFGLPAAITDCEGVRFAACVDPEEPGYNARRMPDELTLMRRARHGFEGPIVLLQHVPLFPPGAHDCPYHYVNAEEIIAAMNESRILISLSGHYHPGIDGLRVDDLVFHTVAAMCERPFCFDVIEIDGPRIDINHLELAPNPTKAASVRGGAHSPPCRRFP